MSPQDGQALLEFILGGTLFTLTLIGGLTLLSNEWKRVQCAHQVFEQTHAHLFGKRWKGGPAQFSIEEDESGITGFGQCGGATERVRLLYVEPLTR